MKLEQESIVSSAIRSFCSSFFAILGISFAGILALVALLSVFSNKQEIVSQASFSSLSDATGNRIPLSSNAARILKIDVKGVIGSKHLNADTICAQLDESRHIVGGSERIKGILLNISTPGGSVIDSDIIYRALLDYKQKHQIPIYAYVDGLCASGGMYIASAADKVYASDVSLVGHVGTLMEFLNFSGALEKLGIQSLTLTEGKGKDEMNAFRPWQPGEDAHCRKLLHYYYERFIDVVTKGRPKISRDDLIVRDGAHVFPAPIAEELGYIDHAGSSLSHALSELVNASIGKENPYQFVQIQTKNWLNDLFEAKNSVFFTGKVKHELPFLTERASHAIPYYYLYDPTGLYVQELANP
ncbi:MAG: putative signal peptide peptidase sppA [Chlamydiales bacterium]|jgi:signal peptide peptidase SppA|nr:putative signal peptide peptidase sppA [Chlamydiales bacterium]